MDLGMLPDTFNVRHAGCCMTAARIISGKLLLDGQSPTVVEGWIQFIDEDGSEPEDMRFSHTWVETDDIIDPTIEQFHDYLEYYDFRREEMERVPAVEYLADPRINANPEIFFEDGVLPEDCRDFFRGTTPPSRKPRPSSF